MPRTPLPCAIVGMPLASTLLVSCEADKTAVTVAPVRSCLPGTAKRFLSLPAERLHERGEPGSNELGIPRRAPGGSARVTAYLARESKAVQGMHGLLINAYQETPLPGTWYVGRLRTIESEARPDAIR